MVWGNCGEYVREKLHAVTATVITGDSYEIRSMDTLKKLNWKTFGKRRKEQQLKYVSKALACMPMS